MNEKDIIHFMLMRDSTHTIDQFAVSKRYEIKLPEKQIVDTKEKKVYPYNLPNKVKVYEDRQKTWFFDIADSLKENSEASFVILMIAVSYLEGNQQFRDGSSSQGNSTNTIKKAMSRVFPELADDDIRFFVEQVRQGFFHDGITRKSIYVSLGSAKAVSKQGTHLIINPHLFLDVIKADFEAYITLLKDPNNNDEQQKFEQFWDYFKGL